MWYQPALIDLNTYAPTITQSTLEYGDFLNSISGNGVTAEIDSGVETTETPTTQVYGWRLDDDVEDTTTTQPTDDLTEGYEEWISDSTQRNTPPQDITYTLPTGTDYTGTSTGYTGGQTPAMAPMTGTFTKPAGTDMMGYQPSQQYTLDSTSPQTPQSPIQTQQYEVRMYRNNAGMTTKYYICRWQATDSDSIWFLSSRQAA